MNVFRLIFFVSLLLPFSNRVAGQYYRQYSTSNGLISNYVYQVNIDSKGYVWFCTDKGVVRFNGRRLEKYTTVNGLTDNEVYNCYEDLNGRMWFYTFNGVFCYYKNGIIYNKSNDSLLAKLREYAYINAIYEDDRDSSLYLGHIYGPIQKIKGDTITTIHTPLALNSKVRTISAVNSHIRVTALFDKLTVINDSVSDRAIHKLQDSYYYNGRLIVSDEEGISLYSNDTLVWGVKDPNVQFANILNAYYDGKGRVLCGTRKGLVVYNINNNSCKLFFENMKVTSSRMDMDGNYWISTFDHGVFYFNKANLDDITLIKNIKDYDLIRTSSGQIFLKNQVDIEFLNPNIRPLKFQKLKFNIPENSEPVLYDTSYLYYHNRVSGSRTYSVNNISGERNVLSFDAIKAYKIAGNEYALFNSEMLCKSTLINGKINNPLITNFGARLSSQSYIKEINSIYLIAGKNILYRYKMPMSVLEVIDTIDNAGSSNYIFYGHHRIYLLANNGALSVYDTTAGKPFKTIKLDRVVYEVIEISVGKYIINTDKGYSLVTSTRYGFEIQPLQYPFYQNDILFLNKLSDRIVCTVGEDIYSFMPEILNQHVDKPRLYIETINIGGVPVKENVEYIEAKWKAPITILLNAVYYGSNKLVYRYRIKEADEDAGNWIYFNGEELSFSFASQGNYHIEIQAAAEGGAYTSGKEVQLTIKPPFFKSYYFFVLSIVVAGFIYFFILHYMHKKRKHLFINEMNFLKLEHKATNALLNPHFIFNAINNIQNLVNQGSKAQASEYLATLSVMIRQNIDNLQFNLVPLSKEMQLVENYIELQNLRFGNNIHFALHNEAAKDCYIPPLLIQTFVENAIIHGYDKQQIGFSIHITIRTTIDDYLIIEINDNGCGFNATVPNAPVVHKKTSLGISFTERRLKRLSAFCKKDYTLRIADASDNGSLSKGTNVTIVIYARLKELIENEKEFSVEN